MEKIIVNIEIKGVAPLIMNKFQEAEISNQRGKKVYDDKEECEKRVYKDEIGYYAPSTWLKACLVKSSKDFKIKGKKSYSDYFKGGVMVNELKIRGNLNEIGYEIYKVPVVVQRARIMRARPMFTNWKLEFSITILDKQISHHLVKDVLESAGSYYAIGDNRVEFGRFEVVKFEKI